MEEKNYFEENSEGFSFETETKEEKIIPSEVQVAQEVQPPPKVIEQKFPFEKWFRKRAETRKFKTHWMEGMKAFADTTRPRTLTEWDNLFAKY